MVSIVIFRLDLTIFRFPSGLSRKLGSASSIRTTKSVEVILVEHVEPEKGCWHTFSKCIGGKSLLSTYIKFSLIYFNPLFYGRYVVNQRYGNCNRSGNLCSSDNQRTYCLLFVPNKSDNT